MQMNLLHSASSNQFTNQQSIIPQAPFPFTITVCLANFGDKINGENMRSKGKVIDIVQDQINATNGGTPGFIDPSVLKGGHFTQKSDIFSLGCLLFNLITGKHLIEGDNPDAISDNNSNINPI
jgi:serine/threonine protein kinase